MWPLNALITLMLVGGGFSAWMAILVWYEIHWRGAVFPLLTLLVAVAFTITALSLSRGMIVMLLASLAYAIYLNRHLLTGQSRRRVAVFVLVLCASVVTNFFAITHLRERMYFQELGEVVESEEDQRIPVAAKPVINLREKVAGLVNFSIDRWVGIEGVMAVSAYPGLGESLFVHALAETPIKAEPSINSEIAPWPHQQGASLRKGVSFMSLPGAIAFLFYAGSLYLLFALMALVVLALQYVEVLVFTLTRNPLLCANVAWLLALMIAHFGGAPKAQVPSLVFLSMAVVLTAGLQSRWFDSFARRFRTYP